MATRFKVHKSLGGFPRDNRHKVYDVKRRNDPQLGPVATLRGSYRWQKVRKLKLKTHPTCEDPFKYHLGDNVLGLAECVHHIIGLLECLALGRLENLGFYLPNLRSLCFDCHNKVEGIFETAGPAAAKRLFITPEQEEQIIRIEL